MKTTTVDQLFISDFLIIGKKTFGPENQRTFEKLLNISGDNRDRVHLNVHQHTFVDNNNNNLHKCSFVRLFSSLQYIDRSDKFTRALTIIDQSASHIALSTHEHRLRNETEKGGGGEEEQEQLLTRLSIDSHFFVLFFSFSSSSDILHVDVDVVITDVRYRRSSYFAIDLFILNIQRRRTNEDTLLCSARRFSIDQRRK